MGGITPRKGVLMSKRTKKPEWLYVVTASYEQEDECIVGVTTDQAQAVVACRDYAYRLAERDGNVDAECFQETAHFDHAFMVFEITDGYWLRCVVWAHKNGQFHG
jgi:hypothetical protein